MEPDNRPYVDPGTEPGDAGTAEWADELPKAGATERGSLAEGGGERDAEGAIPGSPGDTFDDGDAIANRSDEPA